jgi:hypothetical protein
MPVFTDVDDGTFDVLDTGKRRDAADVLAVGGWRLAAGGWRRWRLAAMAAC